MLRELIRRLAPPDDQVMLLYLEDIDADCFRSPKISAAARGEQLLILPARFRRNILGDQDILARFEFRNHDAMA